MSPQIGLFKVSLYIELNNKNIIVIGCSCRHETVNIIIIQENGEVMRTHLHAPARTRMHAEYSNNNIKTKLPPILDDIG